MESLLRSAVVVLSIVCGGVFIADRTWGQDAATASQAAAVLDLSKLPRLNQSGPTMSESVAMLSYLSSSDVATVAKNLQQQLVKEGWKALEGATVTTEYASATFQKKGFSLSLSVTPAGEPGKVLVSLTNHGNVDLKKLPVPKGLSVAYALPYMIIYNSDASVSETKESLAKQLAGAGWEPFGETTATFFVKKNAVRLQVMVNESPTQPGKASAQVSSEQMSVDLPIPPETTDLQYSDSPAQLSFRGTKELPFWISYFKETLGKLGWKATTENTLKIDFKEHLIFRNDKKEMIEIEFRPGSGQVAMLLKYSTAEQVKEESAKADAAIAKAKQLREEKMKKNEAGGNKVSLVVPKGTKLGTKTPQSVELSAPTGTGQKLMADWFKQLKAAGWEVAATIDSKEAGEYSVKQGDKSFNVLVIDPGFIPATITVSTAGDKQLDLKDAP